MSKREMKAGREMDALVAEKVMNRPLPTSIGWLNYSDVAGKSFELCPFYSTHIDAAWRVLLAVAAKGFRPEVLGPTKDIRQWLCGFMLPACEGVYASADTACEAICLAALKALKVPI